MKPRLLQFELTNVPRRSAPAGIGFAFILFAMLARPPQSSAQPAWEYSPYQVNVWVALQSNPELTKELQRQIERVVQWEADRVELGAWRVHTASAPSFLRHDIVNSIGEIDVSGNVMSEGVKPFFHNYCISCHGKGSENGDFEKLSFNLNSNESKDKIQKMIKRLQDQSMPPPKEKNQPDRSESLKIINVVDRQIKLQQMLQGEKLTLVGVAKTEQGFRIRARGLDCRFQQWGPVVERWAWNPRRIPYEVFNAIRGAFIPSARIEKVFKKEVHLRVRASALVRGKTSPAWIGDGAVLQPIVRRNDRNGNIREKNGLEPISWTLLAVKSRDRVRLTGEVWSDKRSPLAGRSSSRVERVALLCKPLWPTTTMRIESIGERPKPLVGYEVRSRNWDAENAELATESEVVGHSDWRGIVEIAPPLNSSLRVLYIKSGGQLLRRLPMVPGLIRDVTTQIVDDDRRLGAEGIARSMEGQFLDLVARREILTTEIRFAIEEKEFAEAKAKIDELRKVEDRTKFVGRINRIELDLMEQVRDSERERKKIGQLFFSLRSLVGDHLDPGMPGKLDRELRTAQGGGNSST